jgi:DNA transformation protein
MARRPPEFIQHLLDLLYPLGEVRVKSMFGGWGFYLDGKMFALAAFDTFFIKADDGNRGDFLARGLAPFRYEMRPGQYNEMSYYAPPPEALEDSAELCAWARGGVEAAARKKG